MAMGFDLYLKHFRTFFILFCITFLPFLIIISITPAFPSNSILSIFSSLFFLFFFLVVTPVYIIASAIVTESYVLGEKPRLNVAIRKILSRLLPLTCLNIRFGIIYVLRFLLLIVPGLIYAINNGYYALSFILRDQRGKAAFQYSQALVKGNWWKVFFFSLLGPLVIFGLQVFMNKVLSGLIATSPALITILSSILSYLVGLGIGISSVLLFLNLDFQER